MVLGGFTSMGIHERSTYSCEAFIIFGISLLSCARVQSNNALSGMDFCCTTRRERNANQRLVDGLSRSLVPQQSEQLSFPTSVRLSFVGGHVQNLAVDGAESPLPIEP